MYKSSREEELGSQPYLGNLGRHAYHRKEE